MKTFSAEVVQAELWPIAWKQCTVIWNLQTSLFQFLSNILVYKNYHVYIFFCKVLSVVFKASSAVSKGPCNSNCSRKSVIWSFVSTPTSPPLFQERHENFLSIILFHDMQIDSFAFFSLASIIVLLENTLNSLYSHTRKSIHCIFCVIHS